jgi:Phage integrase family
MTARGGAREKNGRCYVRARYGRAKRLELRAPALDKREADERGKEIAAVADALVAVGRSDLVRGTARKFAEAKTPAELSIVRHHVRTMLGDAKKIAAGALTSFEDFAKRYTDGELAADYPDHVRVKDAGDDISRLRKYINPVVGDVPLAAFTLQDADRVMEKLPRGLSTATRRQVAQVISRVLGLAVFPGKLIAASPIPRGWMPKVKRTGHYSCLFPKEEAKLLAHGGTSEALRLFCGVLNREGMRLSELLDSEWWQWNLDEGTFTTTKTKTNDPRMWALSPDVARAMKAWQERAGTEQKPFAYVTALGDKTKLALRFRAALLAAGVTRAELHAHTEHTRMLRAHDMRATFVTVSLAAGRSEVWIRDRTAHRSTAMIDRYRRHARQFVELELGGLVELDRAMGWGKSGGTASGGGPPDGEKVVDDSTVSRSGGMADAADSKSAQPFRKDANGAVLPGETDASQRAETAFPHRSPTLLATSRDVSGGSRGGESSVAAGAAWARSLVARGRSSGAASPPLSRPPAEDLVVLEAARERFIADEEQLRREERLVEELEGAVGDRDLKPESVR